MPRKPSAAPADPGPVARPRVRRGNVDDANRLRTDLLDAAMAQFVDGGVDAVSIRGVAAALGVSPMTPYRYFADKAELLRGLWVSVIQALLDRVRVVMDGGLAGAALQRAYADAFLGYWEDHPDHYRLVYMTEKTSGRDPKAPLADAPVYAEILEFGERVTRSVAAEIGAGLAHAKIAGDIRFAMQLGYLQAALVNRRYPWTERGALRAALIEQIVQAVQRCLLDGPTGSPSPGKTRLGAARKS